MIERDDSPQSVSWAPSGVVGSASNTDRVVDFVRLVTRLALHGADCVAGKGGKHLCEISG